MNKDAILATMIGFVVGLVITAILLAGPKLASFLPHISWKLPTFSQSKPTPSKAGTAKQKAFTVTIESPLDQSIQSDSTILVSGSTTSGATVLIDGNTDDAISQVKSDGKFAGKVSLVEGENIITVTSYLKGKSATQSVMVFYTSEQL